VNLFQKSHKLRGVNYPILNPKIAVFLKESRRLVAKVQEAVSIAFTKEHGNGELVGGPFHGFGDKG
jgi:hypothetical protein